MKERAVDTTRRVRFAFEHNWARVPVVEFFRDPSSVFRKSYARRIYHRYESALVRG